MVTKGYLYMKEYGHKETPDLFTPSKSSNPYTDYVYIAYCVQRQLDQVLVPNNSMGCISWFSIMERGRQSTNWHCSRTHAHNKL